MADEKLEDNNSTRNEKVFLLNEKLPCIKESFSFNAHDISESIKDCIVVIDTNVLLMPYNSGTEILGKIITTYEKYIKNRRLYMPGQVAREYIKNRPIKISDLYKGLANKVSSFNMPDSILYPILENVDIYKKINEDISSVNKLKKDIIKNNAILLSEIRSWEWNDPVYKEYKRIFTPDCIEDIELDPTKLEKELERRKTLLIPPGYKDSTKDDMGVGDLIIWKTILSLGSKHKKDLIFVSGDEKADWQHRTDGAGLMPRFELLDEYRRCSDNKTFFIIQLSRFLELSSIDSSTIDEIKIEEERLLEVTNVNIACPNCGSVVKWKLEEHVGASAKPFCQNCEESFHIHRTNVGVTIHIAYERQGRRVPTKAEEITCPYCGEVQDFELGIYPNSTNWCWCINCQQKFPVHRLKDGSIKISEI